MAQRRLLGRSSCIAFLCVLLALAACAPVMAPTATVAAPTAAPTATVAAPLAPAPSTAAPPVTTPGTPATAASPAAGAGRQPLRPNPLLSQGRPVVVSPAVEDATGVVDGHYCTRPAWRTASFPTSLAIKIGTGPSQILFNWNSGYTGDYQVDGGRPSYGLAGDYSIETSTDSTDGRNGNWRAVVTISGNLSRTRAQLIPFAGAAWVRMVVTAPAAGTADKLLAIDEIDVYDASAGTDDAVFFLGDSITAAAFRSCDQLQPSYAALVHAALPTYSPATIDGGIGGVNSAFGADGIDAWLALNPDFHIWAIGYGTNDAWQSVDPDIFERQMQRIIDRIVAAGGRPILAHIPYATKGPPDANVQALNATIDHLTARNGLLPGPDLYTWFKQHPEQLGPDGVHPTDAGSVSMNRLWFTALQPLYAP